MKILISCSPSSSEQQIISGMSWPLAFINVGKGSSSRMRQFLLAAGGETEVRVIKWDLGQGYMYIESNNATLHRQQSVRCDRCGYEGIL